MTQPSVSTFGASASMVSHLYQARIALLWEIRRNRGGDFTVSIETPDDVSFEVGGSTKQRLQTSMLEEQLCGYDRENHLTGSR